MGLCIPKPVYRTPKCVIFVKTWASFGVAKLFLVSQKIRDKTEVAYRRKSLLLFFLNPPPTPHPHHTFLAPNVNFAVEKVLFLYDKMVSLQLSNCGSERHLTCRSLRCALETKASMRLLTIRHLTYPGVIRSHSFLDINSIS